MKEDKSNSFNRKFLFPLIAFSLPFLFLLIIEGGLRLFGYGDAFPVFIEDIENQDYLMMNPQLGNRYFKYYAMATKGQFDVFKKEKTEETFRFFVQGASSVVGFPYAHGLSFPRILERQLKEQFPNKEIEVVNMALAGITSQALLDQVPAIVRQKPDAVLIYAGHNEYYGTDGVASSQSIQMPSWLKNWYQRNKFKIRLIQLVRNITIQPTRPVEGKGTMMERMVAQRTIELNSKKYKAGIQQFQNNLQQILKKYKKAEIPVLVGSLVSNIKDQEPFISEPGRLEEELNSDSKEALWHAFEETKEKCSGCAEDFYKLGQALLELKDPDLAKKAFQSAKEADLLRFRAPDTLNSLIRQMSTQFDNAVYVPVLEAFEAQSPNGMVGTELLLEHVHPNINGYQLMAGSFRKSINELFFEANESLEVSKDTYIQLDSLYGEMLIHRLKMNWPFVDTFETVEPYSNLELDSLDFLNKTALLYYRDEIKWIEASVACFDYYMQTRNYAEANKYTDALIQEISYKEEPKTMKASALMAMEKWEEALPIFRELLTSKSSAQAINGMAHCLVYLKDWEGLKKHSSAHQNNQTINPLFFKALHEISNYELNPAQGDLPMNDRINISFAYGYIGLPRVGRKLLDELEKVYPRTKEIENARRRLSMMR